MFRLKKIAYSYPTILLLSCSSWVINELKKFNKFKKKNQLTYMLPKINQLYLISATFK